MNRLVNHLVSKPLNFLVKEATLESQHESHPKRPHESPAESPVAFTRLVKPGENTMRFTVQFNLFAGSVLGPV